MSKPARPSETVTPRGIRVGRDLLIPMREIELKTSRSGGPGGQHVNKVETQVQARWEPAASQALTETQKRRVLATLGSRLVGGRWLTTRSRTERSQAANRRAALERLAQRVSKALEPRKRRRPSRPTAASREARLEAKRRRSRRKQERSRPARED